MWSYLSGTRLLVPRVQHCPGHVKHDNAKAQKPHSKPTKEAALEAHSGYVPKKESLESDQDPTIILHTQAKNKERRTRDRLELLYVTDPGHPGPGLLYKGTGGASLAPRTISPP